MVTLYKTIEDIKTIAGTEPNIGYIADGDIYELNSRQDINYPAFVVTQGTHRSDIDNDTEIYTLTLFCVDRLVSDQTNKLDVQSWANTTLKTIIDKIEAANIGMVIGDYTVDVFTERFESVCAGAYATIQIEVDVENCAASGLRFVTSVNGMTGDVIINTGTGGTDTDLSNYYTKDEVDELIRNADKEGKELFILELWQKINYNNETYLELTKNSEYTRFCKYMFTDQKNINDCTILIDYKSNRLTYSIDGYRIAKNMQGYPVFSVFLNFFSSEPDLYNHTIIINANDTIQINSRHYLNNEQTTNYVDNKLNGYYSKTTIDQKLQDISTACTCDLSVYAKISDVSNNYYNKQYINKQVEDLYKAINDSSVIIPDTSGGDIDLSQYYTKIQADGIFAKKSEIPNLDNYYTKDEVDDEIKEELKKYKPDPSIYVTHDELTQNYYNKTYINDTVQNIYKKINDTSCQCEDYGDQINILDSSVNDLYGKIKDISVCDCSTKLSKIDTSINILDSSVNDLYGKLTDIDICDCSTKINILDTSVNDLTNKVDNITTGIAKDDNGETPLTFIRIDNSNILDPGVGLFRHNVPESSIAANLNIEYRINGGQWNILSFDTIISLPNKGDYIQFKRDSDTTELRENMWYKGVNVQGRYLHFNTNGIYECTGNLQSLNNYSDVALANFRCLFISTNIVSAPELPATKLQKLCYEGMFVNCTLLKTPPSVLPAHEVLEAPDFSISRSRVYNWMFADCISLTYTPIIMQPEGSYMFDRCYNINLIHTYNKLWLENDSNINEFFSNFSDKGILINYSGTEFDNIPDGWIQRPANYHPDI